MRSELQITQADLQVYRSVERERERDKRDVEMDRNSGDLPRLEIDLAVKFCGTVHRF